MLREAKRAVVALPVVGEPVRFVNRGIRDPRGVRAERQFDGCFLLNSMRKSGTHFVMSMLSNYLWFAFLEGGERLDYVDMERVIWNIRPPSAQLTQLEQATGYRSWWSRHDGPLIWFNNARTIVHTYRNPLDTLVSRYHFFSVNRDGPLHSSLEEAVEVETEAFIGEYLPVRAIRHRSNVLRIAYEQLVRDPAAALERILLVSRIARDEAVLERALEAARPEHVAGDEQRHGKASMVGSYMNVGFIRSGRIGEWKTVLADAHVRRVEEMLAVHRISLDEFVLE